MPCPARLSTAASSSAQHAFARIPVFHLALFPRYYQIYCSPSLPACLLCPCQPASECPESRIQREVRETHRQTDRHTQTYRQTDRQRARPSPAQPCPASTPASPGPGAVPQELCLLHAPLPELKPWKCSFLHLPKYVPYMPIRLWPRSSRRGGRQPCTDWALPLALL